MKPHREKILALQFKYFGDAVLMTPALRALRQHYPEAELHLMVLQEVAPLFQHLPWLDRLWPVRRQHGRARLTESWPFIRQLRLEKFDRAVDFAGNDRSAIMSLMIGARRRLGWADSGGFVGKPWIYHDRVKSSPESIHESIRLIHLLSAWNVPLPALPTPEIQPNPALAEPAKSLLPVENAVIAHVAASEPKKEWPLHQWAELHRLATSAGFEMVFTTARSEREQALMLELKKLIPAAVIIPQISDLALFLAVLARARVFISGDTGPLHFAVGLGLSTISLYGASSPDRWGPLGSRHQILAGPTCTCDPFAQACHSPKHCTAAITPMQVFAALQQILKPDCRP